jgi:hypothetical protein
VVAWEENQDRKHTPAHHHKQSAIIIGNYDHLFTPQLLVHDLIKLHLQLSKSKFILTLPGNGIPTGQAYTTYVIQHPVG